MLSFEVSVEKLILTSHPVTAYATELIPSVRPTNGQMSTLIFKRSDIHSGMRFMAGMRFINK